MNGKKTYSKEEMEWKLRQNKKYNTEYKIPVLISHIELKEAGGRNEL